MTTEPILTERLVLRSTREADGPFCLSIWLDDEMGKYLADPPRGRADAAELNFAAGIEQDDSWYPFVAELRRTGERIGTCSRGGRVFTATAARENAGSNAVLHKLGFRVEKEGSFRKRLTDIVYPAYTYRLDVE